MNSSQLRQEFLEFFKDRGHVTVPSSSLLPDDPSVLLTTAGMQQFKPYFVGKANPKKDFGSLNTVSIQKSFRTSDIDEVGDETHLTFFEMMGNFSFGGYFKEEAIRWARDFLEEVGLRIEYVTVFGGDSEVPRDKELVGVWDELGFSEEKGNLRFMGRKDNFWGPTGGEGPCGPTTEIYINGIEVWNIVFNEYYCHRDGRLEKLETPGVDTGMGLERLAMVVQEKANVFETDLFSSLIAILPDEMDMRIKRIVCDHARSVVFLISDGVIPSNKGAGYILRRLMRRMLAYEHLAGDRHNSIDLLKKIIKIYGSFYAELSGQIVEEEFLKEKAKFSETVSRGIKQIYKFSKINAPIAFDLYQSFGITFEIIKDLGGEKAAGLSREDFDKEFEKHREVSRARREKKFGGHGLILDTGELKAANEEELKVVTRLHTATHLLQAALRKVLGESVHQAGSDITTERLRFDFTFERKLTDEEIAQIEGLVNAVIGKNFDMGYEEMSYEKAIKTGALYFKKEKYPASVKVYSAVDPKSGEVFSRELCGGPHVSHTSELGHFRITKEESAGAGVRRIRAVVDI